MLIGFEILISEEKPLLVVTELSLRFRLNFKQYLLHVQFHRRNEKDRGFHLNIKNSILMDESISDRTIHL